MDKGEILIKPHHFVDILAARGAGQTRFSPHPYGHALHIVAHRLLMRDGSRLRITTGADAICEPCRFNIDRRCTDSMPDRYARYPRVPGSKGEWNILIDTRWCGQMGLTSGDILSVPELSRRILEVSRRIPRIYRELPREYAIDLRRNLKRGLLLFL
jgi:hypothetical protein